MHFRFINTNFLILICSAVSHHGDAAPRVGFFHNFKKSEFLVHKWDAKEEDMSLEGKKNN
jgi:hypothetical protein